MVIVPISVLLIFILLFEALKSVRSVVLILLNVPFALIGGILALYATGIHASVSAPIWFIALFGQAVLDGVVMVSDFNELREGGPAGAGTGIADTQYRRSYLCCFLIFRSLLTRVLPQTRVSVPIVNGRNKRRYAA